MNDRQHGGRCDGPEDEQMPIVRIQLAAGRSPEEKIDLMKSVTDAIHQSIGAPLDTIHVMVQEIPASDIMIGGQTVNHVPKKQQI